MSGKKWKMESSPARSSSSSSESSDDEGTSKKKKSSLSAPKEDLVPEQAKKKAKVEKKEASSPAAGSPETREQVKQNQLVCHETAFTNLFDWFQGVQTKRVSFKSQVASFAAKADDGQDAAAVVEEANTPSTRQHSITDVKKLEADRAKDKKRVDKLLSAFDDSGEEVEAILCFTFWTLCQFEIDFKLGNKNFHDCPCEGILIT